MPPLRGKYNITVSSDSVISLGLKRGHQWADVADADLGTTIFLTSMKYLGEEKLTSPAQIATIIPTPTVKRGDDKVIYMTGSPRLLINGTGFRAKSMTLVFDPPIQSGVDYIMQPRSEGAVQLTLKSGKSWRPDGEPGPLKLKRINTGAGDLRIDAKYGGVTVAEVQANLGAHGVTVETTAEEKLYQSQGELTVLGTGFNTSRLAGAPGLPNPNTLRWANGLKGRGVNYTVVEASGDGTQLNLRLVPGSKWRINPANLPGPLVLLAVKAGAGFVPVGPTEAKKGRVVATVFEDPKITASFTVLFASHSHELWVTGSGFTRNMGTMEITTDPPLAVNQDYTLSVLNRTHMVMTLVDGKSWGRVGPLKITGINTGAGPFTMAPVPVATITDDAEDHVSGLTATKTAAQQLYQSAAIHKLKITGSGFATNCDSNVITFSPPLTKGVDYTCKSATPTLITLQRVKGRKWRPTPGALMVAALNVGDEHGTVQFAYGQGIAVAAILADPTVLESERIIYASHTPRLIVQGTGFDLDATDLTLSPTAHSAYEVESIESTEIVLSLNAGKKWAEPKDDKGVEIVVSKIDTGAGEVVLNDVIIAKVLPDSDTAQCDDSCEWALDGVCDDGSSTGRYWWDDDYGGFYGEGDDDYYSEGYYYDDDDDDFLAPVCDVGTDCTDCGGPKILTEDDLQRCDNSCQWSNDGYCDDTRTSGLCELGTDCHDCGPIDHGNYRPGRRRLVGRRRQLLGRRLRHGGFRDHRRRARRLEHRLAALGPREGAPDRHRRRPGRGRHLHAAPRGHRVPHRRAHLRHRLVARRALLQGPVAADLDADGAHGRRVRDGRARPRERAHHARRHALGLGASRGERREGCAAPTITHNTQATVRSDDLGRGLGRGGWGGDHDVRKPNTCDVAPGLVLRVAPGALRSRRRLL